MIRHALGRSAVLTLAAAALVLSACGSDNDSSSGGSNLSGSIAADGSSTVFPLTQGAAELFGKDNSGVKVVVGESGTGGGFEKFCKGETDISNASRPIKDEEIAICKDSKITYSELQVANDGIALVVNKDNDWVDCLTVAQLAKIWAPEAEDKVTNWNQVDDSFPDQKLELFGAGTASGTFDFFTEQINGEKGKSRTDYNATEDDNVSVQGVEGAKGGLGYFGLSYFEQNQDKLKVVKIDGGKGCIEPSKTTVQSGEYAPLSRPLFIYVADSSWKRPEVKAFVNSYVENLAALTEQALFVPMTDSQAKATDDALAQLNAS